MKYLILIAVFILSGCSSVPNKCDGFTPYISIGASYKFNEFDIHWFNSETGEVRSVGQSPWGGRIQAGLDCGKFKVGYNHESDIFTNFPFDESNHEYYKDEVFVEYVIKFEPLGN